MKYIVFCIAAAGVPPLAFLLYMNRWWFKYVFWEIVVVMCFYNSTAINFFSHEEYRGSSRGMEVSLIYLLSFAMLGAFALRKRLRSLVPETGFGLFIIYFLLCLPSLATAANGLISWFEIWKMMMLYVFYLMVYSYLEITDDLKTVLQGLAFFIVFNMFIVLRDQYYSGVYQPHGVFPHQNAMAMAMLLLGPLFFSLYLRDGIRGGLARFFSFAAMCAVAATMRSFSRMAILLTPVAYGAVALLSVGKGKMRTWFRRMAPIAVLAAVGLAVLLPRIIDRFVNAPEASGTTRLELARCAFEMISDEPWRGVGINNWGIKINYPYDYAERAERETNRGEDFHDGIVETVYLLVGAECGIPALLAMVAWFLWYWASCIRLMKKLRGTRYRAVPVGVFGALTVVYLQGAFEWVLRQQLNLICLMFVFAAISYLNRAWPRLVVKERAAAEARRVSK